MTARVEPLSRAQGVAALISGFTGVRPCCGSRLCSAHSIERCAIAAGAEVVGTDIAAGVERIQGALAGVQASTG
jgi:hypothetical protein